jgi:hypothetical protein
MTEQTMSDSHVHTMWVVELAEQITYMSRFPVYFQEQFSTPIHDQDVRECKGITEMKKLLQSCGSMWSNHESVIGICEPFNRFVVCCIQHYFLKVLYKYV